jgi:hypothetical protein
VTLVLGGLVTEDLIHHGRRVPGASR